MSDIPADTSTTASISVGGTFVGTLETVGDHDWIAVNLTAGDKYTITLDSYGSSPLEDPYAYLRDSSGTVLAQDDDSDGNRNSRIVFTATKTGTYYIDASAWNDGYIGDYQLSVQHFTDPPVYSYDQIADQLVNGYWGGDSHHFNVTQGGTITVNLTGLTTAGQTLARAALQEWSDVIGVNFKEVTTTTDGKPDGQIVFDDSQDGAFTDTEWSNHTISTSNVNISTDWLSDYGTSLESYSFQTYVHEIGHALGLGHAGNYNNDATYPDNALYANDAWSTTVMSYFSQHDSSYFADQGFSEDYALTPMSADIIAMQELYGPSTTTRTGDTIYGYGTNSGNPVFDTSANPHAAYTIVDSGGTDTLNYSQTSADELINLNPLTFSNVAGNIGNVSIGVGTVIENAKTGRGDDIIVGNSANNVLDGGTGVNTVSYETATAGVTVDLGVTTQQNTIGAGLDTLTGFQNLIGSAFADHLTASATTQTIHGGDGDDVITAAAGTDKAYYGDAGNDTFYASGGDDSFFGGDGYDTVDYSRASGPITATTETANDATGSSGTDSLSLVERIIGSAYDDTLHALYAGDAVVGGAGDDTLQGSGGAGAILTGGTGDDTYLVYSNDQIVEAAGEGTDVAIASGSYTLSDNVENLTLSGSASIDGAGNGESNVLTGNSGANELDGHGGDDILYGNGGNDRLDGGTGTDRMYGGTGNDTYVVRDATDYAYENANEGTDTVISLINYALRDNVENLTLSGEAVTGKGNALANVIKGDAIANALYGYDGDDKLYGYDGNDRLDGGTGRNGLYGGTGNDTYYVDNSTTSVHENANEGTDLVVASVNFTLSANVENVTLSDGAVTAKGNDLDNVIRGDDVANALYGYGGSDHLYGYDGNDKLDGGTGVNYLYGGTGDDTYYVDDATSYTYENPGEGTDRVYASVSLTLRANVENLYLTGSAAIAGSGNDLANIIEGNDAANSLKGLGGDDKLYGGGGADSIFGNDGNDWIEGGAGKDTMAGGAGSDSFVFRDGDFGGATTATADRITDFTQGEDHIRLNYVDADTTLAGDQAFSFIGTADFDGHAGELRYTESGSYTFVTGDTNGDGTADFMIRLDGLHTLTSHDFVL